jgi:hypothetical protein
MSTVGPPPAMPLPHAAAAVAQSAVVTNLPPGLANLTAGAIIKGIVVGRDGKGHTLVRTANGTLALTTTLSLATGSTLSLQVQTMGTQVQMVVLSVTEQPAGPAADQAAGGAPPPVEGAAGGAAPAQRGAQPPVTITTETVLTAMVAREVAAGPASFVAAPSAAPGSGAAPPQPASLPTGTVAGGLPLAPLEPGSRLSLRMIAIDPDDSFNPAAVLRTAAVGRPPPPVVVGTVTNRSVAGEMQVQTPLGLLTLNTKAPLPPSTRIVFALLGPVEPPPPSAAAAPAAGSAPLALTRKWAALSEAVETLGRADPALAQNVIENAIPRPGPGLAANLLFLLSALRGGDIAGWLGAPAMRALQRAGRHDLVTRLGEDFAQISRLAADPATGEWRTWLVPVHDGGAIELVRLFIKRHRGRTADDDERDSGTRFLVEVDLSRLGPMQLDGLVQQKRFDLIVRSHAPLPRHMRKDIYAIFDDALAATGYSGGITFQATPTFVVSPLTEVGAHPVGLSV